jgi:hypothetical protein
MHLSEKGVMKCDPNAHSRKAANVDLDLRRPVTGMPFVRQLLVNTHIMSILLQRNSNVHRGIYPVTDTLFPLGADVLKFHCHAHFPDRTKREQLKLG